MFSPTVTMSWKVGRRSVRRARRAMLTSITMRIVRGAPLAASLVKDADRLGLGEPARAKAEIGNCIQANVDRINILLRAGFDVLLPSC